MSKAKLKLLHKDFVVVDRKALHAVIKSIEELINKLVRMQKVIKKLRSNKCAGHSKKKTKK